MKKPKRYRLSVLAATVVVAVGAWMLVGCSKQSAENETGTPVEVALPALVIEPSQALFFGSAAGNPDSAPTQETSPNSDLFSVQVVDPATTAAAETTPSKASTTLSNVWVLQFDGGGTTRACVYVGTVNAESNILATLESGEGYSVWVVANGPGNGSFTTSNPATISDFESKLLYTGNTTADNQIPLCGKIENVTVLKNGQLLVGNNNAVIPSVLLRRAQARVDMILEYDVSGAVFDGAWLYNVPTGACYGLQESAADGFPEAASGNFSYTEGFLEGATHVQGTQNANSTYTWYMGDNRRGTKSDILYEIQKNQYNAPQYATYIRIKGHESADETKYLFHDVYLGKTKTSDFNVLRNWSYTFRVRIGGTLDQHKALTADDPRVSAGEFRQIESVTIDPDPTEISGLGGEYTITIKGLWVGEMPVRIWDGKTALDEGTITYSSESQGGSTTLTVSANISNNTRSLVFQYYKDNNWITIQTGTQDVKQLDILSTFTIEVVDPNIQVIWQEAVEQCRDKGDGWRLPTQSELLYISCLTPWFTDESAFNTGGYWSGTETSSTQASTYSLDGLGGGGGADKTTSFCYVRCVKDKPQTSGQKTYPYITTASDGGVVVVLRDNDGGVDESVLFPERLTQTNTDQPTLPEAKSNRMSRKFRVQRSQPSNKMGWAWSYCNNLVEEGFDDWRLPSVNEAKLLWMMGASTAAPNGLVNSTGVGNETVTPLTSSYLYEYQESNGFTPFLINNDNYWAAMRLLGSGDGAYTFNFGKGAVGAFVQGSALQARCIRDEEW